MRAHCKGTTVITLYVIPASAILRNMLFQIEWRKRPYTIRERKEGELKAAERCKQKNMVCESKNNVRLIILVISYPMPHVAKWKENGNKCLAAWNANAHTKVHAVEQNVDDNVRLESQNIIMQIVTSMAIPTLMYTRHHWWKNNASSWDKKELTLYDDKNAFALKILPESTDNREERKPTGISTLEKKG